MKPPSLFSLRWFKLVRMILKEWRAMKRAQRAKRSSGHLDPSARSAEFHRLRKRPQGPPSVTVIRGTPDRKKR